MPKFPEPPPASVLAKMEPVLAVFQVGMLLWRVYPRAGAFPTLWNHFRTFGPTESRFDHHVGPPGRQDRGILYCARGVATTLAERFQRDRLVDSAFDQPWLVGFQLLGPLTLLDLRSVWPTRAGASMAINTGPRARARRWSRIIYDAYPTIQGLCYPSSMHANRDAVALYERSAPALPNAPVYHRSLDDPDFRRTLAGIAADLGYRIG